MKNVFVITLVLYISVWAEVIGQLPRYQPGELIVKFKTPPQSTEEALSLLQQETAVESVQPLCSSLTKPTRSHIDPRTFYLVRMASAADPAQAAAEFFAFGVLEYAQPNYLYSVDAVPNDPDYSRQSFWSQINAPRAWDASHGDSSVVIAILDTGVDYLHVDLANNIWSNDREKLDGVDNDGNGKIDDVRGWDFVKNTTDAANSEDGQTEDNDPMDGHGHGTHVAGLASAVTNNGVGVAGMGWSCEIMPLRVGYKNRSNGGSILSAAVLNAIDYAVDNGADVINTSFGGIGNDFSTRDMMRYAFDNGVVLVKSAGNSGSDLGYSPENEDFVISVAAVDYNDRKTSYSNFGQWVKISAPGGTSSDGLYSTHLNNKYSSLMGTSMAAPIVSGTAALVRSLHPEWSAAQVMMHVIDTADDIDAANPLYAGQLGVVGRLNAGRALSSPFQSQPKFSIARILVEDLASGNGDKRANIGETTDLNIKLVNRWHDARNVRLQLASSDPQVTVLVSDLTFPDVAGISSSRNYVETIDPYFRIKISDAAFPHNIEFTLTITADGGFVQTLPFHLAIEARVLVVDDDDGFNNVESYYFSVLDSLGMPYDVWDRSRQGRTGTNLKNYHLVIWFCENAFPTLDSSDRDDLIAYLRADRYLFISGQNIAWDLGFTSQTAEDAESRSYYNQYRQVGDATERFLKNQLHALYAEDKTAEAIVKGVEILPLSRGLEFVIASPLRQPTEQSPDVINTTLGSSILFKYQDGPTAAVVYKGAHQVVYWAFGGLEAVVDAAKRQTAMSRILMDFTGMEVKVDKLSNIENDKENIQVRAIVNRLKNLAGVYLYWRQLSQPQFQQVIMAAVNDSLFTGEIPRQSFGTEIEYAVQSVAADGLYSPVRFMRVKIESSAPMVTAVSERKANLSLAPYVTMTASDLSGLDSSSAMVYFWTNSAAKDSLPLQTLAADQFGGRIRGPFNYGDVLKYQFAVNERSALSLRGLSPIYEMNLGFEGFEYGLDAWQTKPGGWGLEKQRVRTGQNAIHESPGQGVNYPADAEVTITLREGLDLSHLSQATLSLWHFFAFGEGDYGYVEASGDSGRTWSALSAPLSGSVLKYYQAEFSLDDLTGPGNDHVLLRFRLRSDASINGPGWFIDDISILPIRTAVGQAKDMIPADIMLFDAYPNPFNAQTQFQYSLPEEMKIRLSIMNTLGQEVAVLEEGLKPTGVHTVHWDGRDRLGHAAPTGLYFYRLQTPNGPMVKKLTLLR